MHIESYGIPPENSVMDKNITFFGDDYKLLE